jgi:metacaspase-1
MTGISLHIGLNQVSQTSYNQIITDLKACENDAIAMRSLAESLGYFHTKVLLTKEATHQAVKAAITETAHLLEAGDIFLLTYSGHGSQILDRDSEESDGLDETWVLYDKELVDDDIYELWAQFKAGVRIVVISDSCHSGTVTKSSSFEKTHKGIDLDKGYVSACGILISACKDSQVAWDGTVSSVFTEALLSVWNDGKFGGSYRQFRNAIAAKLPKSQSPNYFLFGRRSTKFSRQKPFSI